MFNHFLEHGKFSLTALSILGVENVAEFSKNNNKQTENVS